MIDIDAVRNVITPQYLLRYAWRRVGHRYRSNPKQQRSGHIGRGCRRQNEVKLQLHRNCPEAAVVGPDAEVLQEPRGVDSPNQLADHPDGGLAVRKTETTQGSD